MAETVRLVRTLAGSDERVVALLHNGHAQRVPFAFRPGVRAPSAGTHLAGAYGEDYVVVGLTAVAGSTPGPAVDAEARHGIALHAGPLGDPAPDGVEHAVVAAGLGDRPVLLDLRPARGADSGPAHIRHATIHNPVDVVAGYDALYCLPTQEPAAFVAGG